MRSHQERRQSAKITAAAVLAHRYHRLLGYAGLPLAVEFVKRYVLGYDIDVVRVAELAQWP